MKKKWLHNTIHVLSILAGIASSPLVHLLTPHGALIAMGVGAAANIAMGELKKDDTPDEPPATAPVAPPPASTSASG